MTTKPDTGPFFFEGATIYSKQEQRTTRTRTSDWCNLTTINVYVDRRDLDGKIVEGNPDERHDVAAYVHCALNAHPALVAALQKHHDAAWLHHANHGCPICDLDGTRLCPLLTESAAALVAAKGAT